MSRRPKHHRTLCRGCKHGIEHHPKRGACVYGHDTVTGGCMCPLFNTPASKIPDSPPFTTDGFQVGDLRESPKRAHTNGTLTVASITNTVLSVRDGVADLEAARAKLQLALDEFSATVLEIVSRGGAASTSPPQVDAVRSRGRALSAGGNSAPVSPSPMQAAGPASTATVAASFGSEGSKPRSSSRDAGASQEVTDDNRELGAGERAILIVIACAGANGCTDAKLAVVTGYKETSRRTFIQRLAQRGLIDTILVGGVKRYHCNTDGRDELGDFEQPERGAVIRDLPAGEIACFTAIARRLGGCSNTVLSIATGYKETSIRTYLQRLYARELVHTCPDGELKGLHFLTPAAKEEITAAGIDYAALTSLDLQTKLLEDLPEGERLIFGIIAKQHPAPMDRDEIGEIADYKETSTRTYLQRLQARGVIERDPDAGGFVLAEELRWFASTSV